MKALVAALNRIATALEQLVPALTQATREARYEYRGTIPKDDQSWRQFQGHINPMYPGPPDPRYPEDGNA